MVLGLYDVWSSRSLGVLKESRLSGVKEFRDIEGFMMYKSFENFKNNSCCGTLS